MNIAITGTGSAVPNGRPVTNAELVRYGYLHMSPKEIEDMTGVAQRHMTSKNPYLPTTTLAAIASERAIANSCLSPEMIDYIIFATMTPDSPSPQATNLQLAIGAKNAVVDTIEAACAGFVRALFHGLNMILA